MIIAGAFGFLLGLAAHDLAIQGLTDDRPLRPLVGICLQCQHERGWLRPRCLRCGRLVRREPLLALITGLVGVGIFNLLGLVPVLVAFFGFLTLTAALVVTDLEEFRIVDRLNLRGSAALAIALSALALVSGDVDSLVRAYGGALAYFGGTTLLYLAVRGKGFGAGDVKLAPILGLFTAYISWGTLGWAVFATALIGGVFAFGMIIAGVAGMKSELPYGPPMVLGSWLVIALAGIGTFPIPS